MGSQTQLGTKGSGNTPIESLLDVLGMKEKESVSCTSSLLSPSLQLEKGLNLDRKGESNTFQDHNKRECSSTTLIPPDLTHLILP